MRDLARGMETLLRREIGETKAAGVIARLDAALACCDELGLTSDEESLAYIYWHLLDRYGRVQQALDALFRIGHLPIRMRSVTLLEIGVGRLRRRTLSPTVPACTTVERSRVGVPLLWADHRGLGDH